MTQGATAPLTAVRVTVEVTARQRLDVVGVLLTAAGKVRSDADLIRHQAPRGPGVLHRPATGSVPQAITVDTWALPPDVTRVLVAAGPADPAATFAGTGPTATVRDAATGRVLTTFTPPRAQRESALLVVEVYRRGVEWQLRAIGRGYPGGLTGLAAESGAAPDEPAPAPAAAAAPTAFTPTAVPPPMPTAPPRGSLDKGRVKLVKDGSVTLVKQGRALPGRLRLAVGWSPAQPGRSVDLDVSCLAFDAQRERLDTAWFMKRTVFDGAIQHAGELAADDADRTALDLDLSALPAEVCGLVLVLNSFSGQRFTEVRDTYCRLLDADEEELVRYDLPHTDPHPGLILAKLVRHYSGEWVMTALATYVDAKTARGMVQPASRLL
ncbi:stress-induced protein [Streptomyces tateyamensis]|uniref:Stress-induced protein n=1 Tax=Streptomyces tateyamensis TaxID=565073 RepID=A0A2V4N8C8_9ACTN|nr:stress-induced protein [Streptomyces tateyamensis]